MFYFFMILVKITCLILNILQSLPGLVKGNVKSGHPRRGYADKDINISSSRHTEIDK